MISYSAEPLVDSVVMIGALFVRLALYAMIGAIAPRCMLPILCGYPLFVEIVVVGGSDVSLVVRILADYLGTMIGVYPLGGWWRNSRFFWTE